MRLNLPAILGGLTAAYGAAVLVKPAVFAKPIGLAGSDGSVSAGVGALCRAVGVRDLASGLAMVAARTPGETRLAIAVRVAADVGDAVILGLSLPDADARRKAAAVGVIWGGLNAATLATLD